MSTSHLSNLLRACTLGLLLALAGCANSPGLRLQKSELGYRLDEPRPAPSSYAGVKMKALLIAIGNEQPVFDRFVVDLTHRFRSMDFARIGVASSSGKIGRRLRTPDDAYRLIRAMKPQSGEGCFIYLTGHGGPAGMAFPESSAHVTMPPQSLAAAVDAGCGERPTVLVISSCFSGVYMQPGIAAPNRIVLTAADPDHPSFGCGNDSTYTYFDGCFIGSLDGARTWQTLAAKVQSCVDTREARLGGVFAPSNPQAFFGRNMRDLPLPASRTAAPTTPDPTEIIRTPPEDSVTDDGTV